MGQTFKPDVKANRSAVKWSKRALLGRLIWETVRTPLFAWSPRQWWSWRSRLLRLFGAKIGKNVQLHPTVDIIIPWNLEISDDVSVGDHAILYALGKITLTHKAMISQRAHLCAGTHDYNDPAFPLIKSQIRIGEGTWICADVFIGPDINVGAGSIVGARSVVVKDVPDFVVAAGHPAKVIRKRKPLEDKS